MCVIAYYPANVEAKKTTLENCFDNNPDGAGIMYQANGKVIIAKGYMTFDTFYEAFQKIPTDVDRVLHFRIATAGAVDAGNCHPFPICGDIDEMRLTKNVVNAALAHNGVLSDFSPTGGIKAKYSDTMNFIKTVLHGTEEFLFHDKFKDVLELAISGSRFAIMNGNETKILGNFNQYEEAFFSNTSYCKRTSYVYPKSAKLDGYDYKLGGSVYGNSYYEDDNCYWFDFKGIGEPTKAIADEIAKELDNMGYITISTTVYKYGINVKTCYSIDSKVKYIKGYKFEDYSLDA